jgi:hypothetical protein
MNFSRLIIIFCGMGLSACQTAEHVQFNVPHERIAQLISALRSIGLRHNMVEKTRESEVPGTLVLMSQGDLSFTQLGARRYKGHVLVDLFYRSAGVGGQLYHQLEPEVTQALQDLYAGRITIERDHLRIVPVRPTPNQSLQPTASRRDNHFSMISNPQPRFSRAPARRG